MHTDGDGSVEEASWRSSRRGDRNKRTCVTPSGGRSVQHTRPGPLIELPRAFVDRFQSVIYYHLVGLLEPEIPRNSRPSFVHDFCWGNRPVSRPVDNLD